MTTAAAPPPATAPSATTSVGATANPEARTTAPPPSSWQLSLWPSDDLQPAVDVTEVSRLFEVAAQQEQALLLLDRVVVQLREARTARRALQRLSPTQLSLAMAHRTDLLRHGADGHTPNARSSHE